MGGYTKNIAVIRGLKEGFSSNGGELSGLVKAEKYGSKLTVEVCKINFAPLTEGKYVTALSDGKECVVFDGDSFEGESAIETGGGFAALVCFVNGSVRAVASAVCGGFGSVALGLKAEVERTESRQREQTAAGDALQKKEKESDKPVYDDEAMAEVNYYEYETLQNDEGGGAVCADEEKEEDGSELQEDEASLCAVEKARRLKLAGGIFWERMKGEIDGLLSAYPPEDGLCGIIEGSKWVKITYGDGKYYVFGVIYENGTPRYLGYGVPAERDSKPPESMAHLASFIPSADGGGWWLIYQDAETGAALKLEAE